MANAKQTTKPGNVKAPTAAERTPTLPGTAKPAPKGDTTTLDGPVQTIPIRSIYVREGWNTRKDFDDAKLRALAEDIKVNGMIQAVAVTPVIKGHAPHEAAAKAGATYILVAGERRFRAQRLNGAETISARIVADSRDVNVAENFQRENLAHWERITYVLEARKRGESNTDIARKLCLSPQVTSTDYSIGTKLAPEVWESWKKYPNASKVALRIYSMTHEQQREEWAKWLAAGTDDDGNAAKPKRDKKAASDGAKRASAKELEAAERDLALAVGLADGEVKAWLEGAVWALEYAGGGSPSKPLPVAEFLTRVSKVIADSKAATKPGKGKGKGEAAAEAAESAANAVADGQVGA